MNRHYKPIILENFFDINNRLCSPKLTDSYVGKICEELCILRKQHEMSYSQLFHHIMNDIPMGPNICEFCNKQTKYISFFIGYHKTCKDKKCLIRAYGKNPPILSDELKNKISTRMKLRNPMFDPVIVKKAHDTTFLRYGVQPFHLPENKTKALNNRYDSHHSFSSNSPRYATKDYTMPSGVIVKLQGYEPFALDYLLTIYDEKDIVICGKNYYFTYEYVDKTKKYYPDIYIPKEKLFIEVKSPYTYNIALEINNLKHDAVVSHGYMHKFYIFTKDRQKISLETI